MAESKKKTLHVSATMVTALMGGRIVYFYKGDVLPDGVEADSIEHLKSLGFVTEDDVSPVD